MSDLLIPHLIDLLERSEPESFLVGGGLGMLLKREHLVREGAQTLVADLPVPRATADIDLFLRLHLFSDPSKGRALRVAIDDLGYEVLNPKWQFLKPLLPDLPKPDFTLDLLSRPPIDGESIRFDDRRVGRSSGADIHGRTTPEAFAVESMPVSVLVARNDNSELVGIQVPHPYAWINMKVRAASEWLAFAERRSEPLANAKAPSPKHAFDVVLLVAMLTAEELQECGALQTEFVDLGIAKSIRNEASVLFADESSLGWIEAVRQGANTVPHDLFLESFGQVLGLNL